MISEGKAQSPWEMYSAQEEGSETELEHPKGSARTTAQAGIGAVRTGGHKNRTPMSSRGVRGLSKGL